MNAAGLQPVAISVDPPAESKKLATKAQYTFPILSDESAKVIAAYDLLDKGAGIDGHDVSRPAEFIIDPSGIVRWRNLTHDYRVRTRPEEVLSAARSM